MKNNIKIGCSSFYNSKWKNVFYPQDIPSAKWFEYYCTQFNTYEVNGSFYKFPTLKIMENWYKRTPDDFLFSVKAPKEITHLKKFIEAEELLAKFYNVCASGLKHKLGCVLFQLPPSYHYSSEKLNIIIKSLDLSYKNVIEFRHESWWIPEVWNVLQVNKITFCSVSHPLLPTTIFTQFPIIYIRFHGREKMFYSEYSKEELNAVSDVVTDFVDNKQTFIFFNNTASTAGIVNAVEMKKLF